MKEVHKSSVLFTVSTKFAKMLQQGNYMKLCGLFCEVGQFTEVSQRSETQNAGFGVDAYSWRSRHPTLFVGVGTQRGLLRACCGNKDESKTRGVAARDGGGTWGIQQQTIVTGPGGLLLENDIKTEKLRVWI